MSGRILVAEEDGVYLMKFEGDVRLTLCAAVDSFLDTMLDNTEFKSVLVDLCGAEGIDSTALGVLAKLSIHLQRRFGRVPDLVCDQPHIRRVLESMGFDDVFCLHTDRSLLVSELPPTANRQALNPSDAVSEVEMQQRVLAAHKVLMELNSANQERFRDLVATLEDATAEASRTN